MSHSQKGQVGWFLSKRELKAHTHKQPNKYTLLLFLKVTYTFTEKKITKIKYSSWMQVVCTQLFCTLTFEATNKDNKLNPSLGSHSKVHL